MKDLANLPSMRALHAFICVAKFGSVSEAAKKLNTSQTAISRHLRHLESHLGVQLVTRAGRGIMLSATGKHYAAEITKALTLLRDAQDQARSKERTLTIACTHEVSHLILMPRYATLKEALGHDVYLQLLTCEYSMMSDMIMAGADITFEYATTPPPTAYTLILKEAITPLAAPQFYETNQAIFKRPRREWRSLRRIELAKDNNGWATWRDRFGCNTVDMNKVPLQSYDNYVYALEAAVRGEGMVLGWRGFAERYIESGQLLILSDSWHERPLGLYAALTANGQHKKIAHDFLRLLSKKTHKVGTETA